MRLIVQRVKKSRVIRSSDGKLVGKIGCGLLILVGFKKGDTINAVEFLADKLLKLRVMSDLTNKINLSVKDVNGSFLIVSQFTLYADTSEGNRPSFIDAEDPVKARILYNLFIEKLRASGVKTETGSFGDYMEIDAKLDGPVTILYDN